MITKRINRSETGALRPWLIVSLIAIALLVALPPPVTLAQSADNGYNQAQAFLGVDTGSSGMDIINNQLSLEYPQAEALADYMIFLPLVMNNYPFTPIAPVLNAISNKDGDGNYTVSWNSSKGAQTYTLQGDDNADFSSPTTVYSGTSTSKAISGRDVGTYYYRVGAFNSYADSGWSNVELVVVTTPLPDCPQTGLWHGDTSQGGGRNIDFVVENLPACQIAAESLRIEFRDGCGTNRTTVFNASVPITNNHFDIEGASTQVIGDFSSSSTASGTFYYSAAGCTASGTWTAALGLGANGTIYALAVQVDGKILVGGSFSWLGGQRRDRIARLNPDGTLDDSFSLGADGTVNTLALQSDGKIVVGGYFEKMGGQTRYYIARLNPDGSLDTGFNPGNYDYGNYWSVNALAVQADGKIVVGGYFEKMGGQTRYYIARLNTDGSLDTTFNPQAEGSTVYTLVLQADGKILVGIDGYMDYSMLSPIRRLNPDGSQDYTFLVGATGAMHNTYVYTLLVQGDGKIVVGGYFLELEGVVRSNIGRLNSDGSLDTTFNPDANMGILTAALQADGKIVLGGVFTTLGEEPRIRIGRLNADGSLDTTFNPGANGYVRALALQADGKILVGGSFTTLGGETRLYIARLNPDGSLDASFP
ncbi:MAG TPA: delta-60 repeat domain-containing protein [Anaerolineales bacterium]